MCDDERADVGTSFLVEDVYGPTHVKRMYVCVNVCVFMCVEYSAWNAQTEVAAKRNAASKMGFGMFAKN